MTTLARFYAIMTENEENLILTRVFHRSAEGFAYLRSFCNNSPSIGVLPSRCNANCEINISNMFIRVTSRPLHCMYVLCYKETALFATKYATVGQWPVRPSGLHF